MTKHAFVNIVLPTSNLSLSKVSCFSNTPSHSKVMCTMCNVSECYVKRDVKNLLNLQD